MKKRLLYLSILFFTSSSVFEQETRQSLFKAVPGNETGINFAIAHSPDGQANKDNVRILSGPKNKGQ